MDRFAMLFLTLAGLISIYAGYQLFCGLPALRTQGVTPASVLLLNIVPGALLAVGGIAILTVEARTLISHPSSIEHRQPSNEGATWHRTKAGLLSRSA